MHQPIRILLTTLLACAGGILSATAKPPTMELRHLSSVSTSSSPSPGAAEIVAHDPATQRLLIVNAPQATVDVLSIADPAAPTLVTTLDVTAFGAVANSVAVKNGLIAVAVEATRKTDPGVVVFFNSSLQVVRTIAVGSLPDMLTFTPDGRYVIVANEGEPNSYGEDDSVDPLGTVSIIDLDRGLAGATVRSVDFRAFNGQVLDSSIRIFGPDATVAQDLEPEYIAVSQDSKTAWVTLQENNAVAVIDIRTGAVQRLAGLGTKNHNAVGAGLDPSDRDNAIAIAPWPVRSFYLPDGIATYRVKGQDYILLANEGDAREWPGYVEDLRIGAASVALDPKAFPNGAALKSNSRLGRLKIIPGAGDTDRDGDYDVLYAFGGRSFSIRRADGSLVWDSGDQFEQKTAAALPANFNASNDTHAFDNRSDDKGPEPESVIVGKVFGREYAFIGLERIGGVMVYDVSEPAAPEFVQYVNFRDFTQPVKSLDAGDLGPEGLAFIAAEQSPIGKPLLVIANEVSGTTTIFEIDKKK